MNAPTVAKESRLSLGVIGSPVTFVGQAAALIRSECPFFAEPQFFSSGAAMVEALSNGKVAAAVGAHASMAGGYTTFGERLMAPDSKLYVIYERPLPFGCCVLAKDGAQLGDITVLRGGPASLPLAQAFVAENMPRARCEQYANSAATVAEIIAGNGLDAMLGTRSLAEQSGLAILAADIDGAGKTGNWWVISTKALFAPDPTTLFVTARAADDGTLGDLLGKLARIGYGLATISGRPTGGQLLQFDYLLRLRGTGRLDEVQAVVAASAGARLAGATDAHDRQLRQ